MMPSLSLNEISKDIRYGMTASAANCGTHRFIRITDITDYGQLKSDGAKYVSPSGLESEKYSVAPGDLLVARSGSVGRPYLVDSAGLFVFASYLIRFRIDQSVMDPEFLFYFTLSPDYKDYINSTSRGAAIKNINAKQLGDLNVPCPPKTEQRRIVTRIKECMDRAEEIDALRDESLREQYFLLESQIEAVMAGANGEEVKLSEVCQITSALIDPREDQYIDMLHVGGANIESKTGMLIKLKTAQEEGLKSGKFVFDESMVLYNKIRPYLIKVARPDFSGLCSADMYPLSPNSDVLTRDYLFYLLMSRGFTQYAIAGSNRAGMPKVNRKHLFDFEFNLPPIEVQKSLTQVLDSAKSAIEELREDMTTGQSEVKALRESILRKAFAGEL
jgi:type I restriction enzyme S subunit